MLLFLTAAAALAMPVADAQAILQIEAQRLPPRALERYVDSEDPALRARAARALGRLRAAGALAPLGRMVDDPSAEVRFEAAFALGQTPGAERELLARLGLEEDPQIHAALCGALGKQGTAAAIPALLEDLTHQGRLLRPSPVAPAAARALGQMAARGMEGLDQADVLGPLLDQLGTADRSRRRAAAFALARIRATQMPEHQRSLLFERSQAEPDAVTQALLVRATGSLEFSAEAQNVLYAQTVQDPDRGVRIATARAGAAAGWGGVQALLRDPVPAVRRAAIEAIGGMQGVDRLGLLEPIVAAGAHAGAAEDQATVGSPALSEAADAVRALAAAELLPRADHYMSEGMPTAVRAAAVGHLKDGNRLARLATKDLEAPVRTAAAYRLVELEHMGVHAEAVLAGPDPVVASLAAEWLAEHPKASAEAALLAAISRGQNPDLCRQGLTALLALYEGRRPLVRRPQVGAADIVLPLLAHPNSNVRDAASQVAAELGAPAPPGGHALMTAPLGELARITGARVLTARGEILIELYPQEAPLTVWNFTHLAEQGYFDGLKVHRVVPDFVVQDGDPRGDGAGGPVWNIPDEINPLPYREGTVGMALAGPDTGSSQWFITLSPQPHLDGTYTVFGQVLQGMPALQAVLPGDRIEKILIERAGPQP